MRLVFILPQVAIICACAGWFIYSVDWTVTFEAILSVSVWVFCLVVIQRCTPYIFLGFRLATMFSPYVSKWHGMQASIFCLGTNALLPARLGEITKIAWLKSISDLPFPSLLSGCFVERLLDVTALLALVIFFASAYAPLSLVIVMGLGVVFAWLAMLCVPYYGPYAAKKYAHVPLSPKVRIWLAQAYETLTQNITRQKFLALTFYTCVIWGLNYTHVFFVSNVLLDLKLTYFEVGAVFVTIFFSSALLLAPAGVGVMEASLLVLMPLLGTTSAQAATMAILVRLLYSVPPVALSMVLFISNRQRIGHDFYSVWSSVRELKHFAFRTEHKK